METVAEQPQTEGVSASSPESEAPDGGVGASAGEIFIRLYQDSDHDQVQQLEDKCPQGRTLKLCSKYAYSNAKEKIYKESFKWVAVERSTQRICGTVSCALKRTYYNNAMTTTTTTTISSSDDYDGDSVLGQQTSSNKTKLLAYIFGLRVDPAFRRRNIGKRLVAAVTERAKAKKVDRVYGIVLKENDPTRFARLFTLGHNSEENAPLPPPPYRTFDIRLYGWPLFKTLPAIDIGTCQIQKISPDRSNNNTEEEEEKLKLITSALMKAYTSTTTTTINNKQGQQHPQQQYYCDLLPSMEEGEEEDGECEMQHMLRSEGYDGMYTVEDNEGNRAYLHVYDHSRIVTWTPVEMSRATRYLLKSINFIGHYLLGYSRPIPLPPDPITYGYLFGLHYEGPDSSKAKTLLKALVRHVHNLYLYTTTTSPTTSNSNSNNSNFPVRGGVGRNFLFCSLNAPSEEEPMDTSISQLLPWWKALTLDCSLVELFIASTKRAKPTSLDSNSNNSATTTTTTLRTTTTTAAVGDCQHSSKEHDGGRQRLFLDPRDF